LQKPTVKIPDDEEAKFIWQKHMSVEIITKNYVNFAKTYVESQEHSMLPAHPPSSSQLRRTLNTPLIELCSRIFSVK
jgi:hypothetical protein